MPYALVPYALAEAGGGAVPREAELARDGALQQHREFEGGQAAVQVEVEELEADLRLLLEGAAADQREPREALQRVHAPVAVVVERVEELRGRHARWRVERQQRLEGGLHHAVARADLLEATVQPQHVVHVPRGEVLRLAQQWLHQARAHFESWGGSCKCAFLAPSPDTPSAQQNPSPRYAGWSTSPPPPKRGGGSWLRASSCPLRTARR